MEWDEDGPFGAVFGDPASHVWTLAPDGTVERANDRARALATGDPTGERLSAVVDWGAPDEVRERVERALAGEYDRGTARARDDEVVLDLALRPVGAGNGSAGGVVVGGRDVTDRVRDRRALAEQREKMAALHDVATELVGCEEPAAVYERTVDAAEEILDLTLCFIGVVEDDKVVPTAHSQDDPRHVNVLSTDHGLAGETLRTGESFLVEDTAADDLSEPVHEDYRSGLSVPVGEDAIFQAVATERGAFDETDLELVETLMAHAAESARRARTERTLRRQNERLEEFASVVAHDLRNPLAGLRANAQLARETGDEEALDAIVDAVDRMEGLVDEVLQLSRSGEVVDEPELVSLRRAAREAWREVDAPGVELAAGDADVRADPPRLRRLLENLLSNAVAHGGDVGTVEVAPIEDDEGATRGFYVADDGDGIPPDEREDVFERGYTTSSDGTGFGLPIVREIAEAHGWDVALAESEAGGARFEFTGV